MKTIILLRHAYAERHSGKEDFYRHLSPEGVRVAKLMSCELKERISEIDLIVSSAALRTKETAEIFRKDAFPETSVRFEKDLYYLQFTNQFFDFVYTLDESFDTVLFVGHNPVFSFLTQSLSGDSNRYLYPGSFLIVNFKAEQWTEINNGTVENSIFVNSKLIQEQTME
ncbi:MAG: histidine phosphatase family protein [Bacteroidales bacterium]|nr:histidine phosphatase family protein [Bacteroidales bacterium]